MRRMNAVIIAGIITTAVEAGTLAGSVVQSFREKDRAGLFVRIKDVSEKVGSHAMAPRGFNVLSTSNRPANDSELFSEIHGVPRK